MRIDLKEKINFFLILLRTMLIRDTWQHINRCDVLLVRHDNNCGYRYNGKAYAQLIDSFGELCLNHNLTVSSIATPHSRLIGEKAQFSPVSFDRSWTCVGIIGKILRIIIGYERSKEWTQSHYTHIWCRTLGKAQPKCIIGIQPDEFLCQAGKLKKIPVYDLQHGLNTDEDPYYGEAFRLETPAEKLPAGFLCWDEQSAYPISKWALNKGIRVLIVGNPWFIRFAKTDAKDLLVNKALAENNIIDDCRPSILVSLEDKLIINYPDQVNNGFLADALEKVILKTRQQYNWILRLHPVQLNGIEKGATLDYLSRTFGIERTRLWLEASWIPLPVVLRKTDLHITFSSAVVIEAARMGIRSGILNKQIGKNGKTQDWFSYERSLGMADVLPQNPEVIKQWIANTLDESREKPLFENDGENLDAFIKEIVMMKS